MYYAALTVRLANGHVSLSWITCGINEQVINTKNVRQQNALLSPKIAILGSFFSVGYKAVTLFLSRKKRPKEGR